MRERSNGDNVRQEVRAWWGLPRFAAAAIGRRANRTPDSAEPILSIAHGGCDNILRDANLVGTKKLRRTTLIRNWE